MEKSAVFSPAGGTNPHFFPKKVASMVQQTGNFPKKMVKNRGTFFFGPFLGIWGILGQNGEIPGTLLDSKVLKKTVRHPYGATSDALQRVYLGSRGTEDTKYTLWRASEVAP